MLPASYCCTRVQAWLANPGFHQEYGIIAGSLESANSSILPACGLVKDFGGEKVRIL